MPWIVDFAPEFEPEFDGLPEEVQDELLARARVLEQFGPMTKRPTVDTLNGSKYTNLKELRFDAADGVWRVAFAFDPERKGILLTAGDKSGQGEQAFYRRLIKIADERYAAHLVRVQTKQKASKGKGK